MRRSGVCRSWFGSWRHSARYRDRYSSDAHQVAGGHREFELLIDPLQTAKHGLPDAAYGLAPAERLLNPFANDLAQAVTGMTGGAPVDRATATAGIVAGDVWVILRSRHAATKSVVS